MLQHVLKLSACVLALTVMCQGETDKKESSKKETVKKDTPEARDSDTAPATLEGARGNKKLPDINSNLRVGYVAPDFEIKDTSGKGVKISDMKGKIIVLEWTNPNCPFVKKHYESDNMQKLQKKYTEKGVVWITIDSSAAGKEGYMTPEEAKVYVDKTKAVPSNFILDTEGKIGRLYNAQTTPHMFVIDKEGKIAYMGAIDDRPSTMRDDVEGAANYVVRALDAIMDGKEPPEKATDPYGCSVKYAS